MNIPDPLKNPSHLFIPRASRLGDAEILGEVNVQGGELSLGQVSGRNPQEPPSKLGRRFFCLNPLDVTKVLRTGLPGRKGSRYMALNR